MRGSLLAIISALAVTPVAAAGFEINVDVLDLLPRTGHLSVADLAVGEVGIVPFPEMCLSEGQLVVPAIARLAEAHTEYGNSYRIKRLPRDAVEITMAVGERSDKTWEQAIADFGINVQLRPCVQVGPMFTVTSINGVETLLDLFDSAP